MPYDAANCVIAQPPTMTYQEQAEVRRPSVGTKVLMVGLAVFAVLGSFWTIVWFIRAYVEAPRVNIAPIALAARESTPVVPPAPMAPPAPIAADTAQATTANPPSGPSPPAQAQADNPAVTNAIADRWLPMTSLEPPAPADPAPAAAADPEPAVLATAPDPEPQIEEVAESSVPAISGAAPLPRRKPTQTAAVRPRNADPPLPRPRPDGPAPQSVWTAVPTTDDRYQATQ